MKIRRVISRRIADLFSFAQTVNPVKSGLRILMYHSVGGQAIGDTEGIFSVTKDQFNNQIKTIYSISRYLNISLEDADISSDLHQLAVTFDDGYRDNLIIAAPILLEYSIPFTVYVTSKFVKDQVNGFLSPRELQELAAFPRVSIGSHGKTHKRLTSCSDIELEEELRDSKNYLEDLIGRPVTTIAYPHGAVDSRVRSKAKQLEYNLGVCSQFGINQSQSDPLMLRRMTILRDDTDKIFRQKLSGAWDWYRFRDILS